MPDFSQIEHNPRLVSSWPEEVKFRMHLAYEAAYHSGVRPRGAAPFRTDVRGTGTVSKGHEVEDDPEASRTRPRSDLNIGPGVDPNASLGARLWYAGDPDTHDVYNEPVQETEFIVDDDSPAITMGVLKFDEESDRSTEVTEFGRQFTRDARFTIPVWHHHLNDIPAPSGGDLLEFWGDSKNEFGVFYNVTEVWRDGFILSSSYFVNWGMELHRRDDFVPERRLLGE